MTKPENIRIPKLWRQRVQNLDWPYPYPTALTAPSRVHRRFEASHIGHASEVEAKEKTECQTSAFNKLISRIRTSSYFLKF